MATLFPGPQSGLQEQSYQRPKISVPRHEHTGSTLPDTSAMKTSSLQHTAQGSALQTILVVSTRIDRRCQEFKSMLKPHNQVTHSATRFTTISQRFRSLSTYAACDTSEISYSTINRSGGIWCKRDMSLCRLKLRLLWWWCVGNFPPAPCPGRYEPCSGTTTT